MAHAPSPARRLARITLTAVATLAAALALAPIGQAAEPGVVSDITWGTSRADVDRTVALTREAGARWVRANIAWNAIERDGKGVINQGYLASVDYAVQAAHKAGLQVLMPIADGVPYWASADPAKSGGSSWNKMYRPTNGADYADFVRFVVRRYAPLGVRAYQIWNEPNHPRFWPSGVNAREYVDLMLRPGYAAVKQADPSATVVLGGLSKNDYGFLGALYAAGARAHFDVAAFHPYTGRVSPLWCWKDSSTGRLAKDAFCAIEEMRATMVANGDSAKAIWLTEFGWATGSSTYAVSGADQALFISQAFSKLAGYPYVSKAFYYGFRNVYWLRDDAGDLEANFGLLRTDYAPKLAYDAFRTFAAGSTPTSTPTSTTSTPTSTSSTSTPTSTTTTTTTTSTPTSTTTTRTKTNGSAANRAARHAR